MGDFVHADETHIQNITTDTNGTVEIKQISEVDNYGSVNYQITITPKDGYFLDSVSRYYDTDNKDSLIQENIASFEDGTANSKIWHLTLHSGSSDKIKVTFGKQSSTGILRLTSMKSTFQYGENIQLEVSFQNTNGTPIKFSSDSCLYLYDTLGDSSYGRIIGMYDSETLSKGIINIDSTQLNGVSELSIRGIYNDRSNNLSMKCSNTRIIITKTQVSLSFDYLEQTEGNTFPVAVITNLDTSDIKVEYKISQNGKEKWTSQVPKWEGSYPVRATITNSKVMEDIESTATLVIHPCADSSSLRTNNINIIGSKNGYVDVTILDKKLIVTIFSARIDFSSLVSTFQNRSSTGLQREYDLRKLNDGTYDLTISNKYYNFNKIQVVVHNGNIFLQNNSSFSQNKKTFTALAKKLKSAPTPKISAKYSDITKKAKELTKDCKSDYEKAKNIFVWITENIYYDMDAYHSHNYGPQDALSVYQNKKAVCRGYAQLMHVMLNSVGIRDTIVFGYADNAIDSNSSSSMEEHAWNITYCSELGHSIIVDSTWGSRNKLENGVFHKKTPNYTYFDTSLPYFSLDHWFDSPNKNVPVINNSRTIKVGEQIPLLSETGNQWDIKMVTIEGDSVKLIDNRIVKGTKTGKCNIEIVLKNGNTKNIIITVVNP